MSLYLLGAIEVVGLAIVLGAGGPVASPVLAIGAYIVLWGCSWLAARRLGTEGTERCPRAWLWGVAVFLRVLGLFLEPGSDLYRYLWEGRIQEFGYNPYSHAPSDPALGSIENPHRGSINHTESAAIYGPLFLLVCAAVAWLWYSPLAFKIIFMLMDLGLLAVLAAGRRPLRERMAALAGYGWAPLSLFFIAGEGHNEIAWLLPFVLGLRAIQAGRGAWAALAFGAALAVKPTALVGILFALPALSLRFWAIVVLVPALFCIPYLAAGSGLLRSLIGFASTAHANDLVPFGIYSVLLPVAGYHVARFTARGVSALALGWVWLRERPRARTDVEGAALAGMGSFLVFSPAVHAWYALPAAALAAGKPRSPWWWLVGGMGFYFLYVPYTVPPADPWLMRALTYGPFLAALAAGAACRFLRARRDRRAVKEPEMLSGTTHGEVPG